MSKFRITDKQALKEWEAFYLQFIEDVDIDSTETEEEKLKRMARLEADDEAWFMYYFPKWCTAEPAPFHKKSTKRVMENNRCYIVRAWSRELAKSARSMMELLKLALTKKIKNQLLISNSWDNAVRLLMPFKLNLERNKRIINDYGEQKTYGQWENDEFVARCGCSYRAVGAGQSPRGTRNEAARADSILIDDIDTDEECRNPDLIKKKWAWIEQALIPTLSISGNYRIIVNGNIIAKYCCVTEAMKKAKFVEVVNIRDKNGKSVWPQKNSEEDIDEFFSLLGGETTVSVQQEFYNNPVVKGDVFEEMIWGKCPPLSRFRFVVAYGDPSTSNKDKKGSSTKAIPLVGFHDGKYYVITCLLDKTDNETFVQWFYDLRDYVNDKTQVYFPIENNALQDPFYEQVFMPLFAKKAKETGYTLPISPDTRKKPEKFYRIEGNLKPLVNGGKLILNEAERDNPHMTRLCEQFEAVTPKLSIPADGPDAVEGAVWIINEKLSKVAAGGIWTGGYTNKKRF